MELGFRKKVPASQPAKRGPFQPKPVTFWSWVCKNGEGQLWEGTWLGKGGVQVGAHQWPPGSPLVLPAVHTAPRDLVSREVPTPSRSAPRSPAPPPLVSG